MVCLSAPPHPRCPSWFTCTQMWDHLVNQQLLCCKSSMPQLPISASPTILDECFFFNSLVVGLPYSSIFWQFWLFLFLNLLLSFFWLCKEAQCVYLPLHLGWKSSHLCKELCSILLNRDLSFFFFS